VRKIGITLGDPAGVGPEVTLRALASFTKRDFIPVIVGRRAILETLHSRYLPFALENFSGKDSCAEGAVYIYDITSSQPVPRCGDGTIETARESLVYIDHAVKLWQQGDIDAVVTGPVHKGLIEKSGTPFMGHTEYIAEKIGEKNPYMMMFSEKLRVLLVTTHYPIKELPALVTRESIFNTICTGHDALLRIDGKAPRIAVAGFDPHCGDSGAIGSFDMNETSAAIERARSLGIDVHGPFSADTLFLEKKWQSFDLAIAHYHDQGLIPFKILAFDKGVNVTLGLSIVRTSVDHGTAFDIAGKGIASFESMSAAIRLAVRLVE
jgi:4-phospho-D-threonate 3-dehydrogenase / 4-phospho-D-erythronate 3-dehydrogenase